MRKTGNQGPVIDNDSGPGSRYHEEEVDPVKKKDASKELVREPGQEPVASGRLDLDQ